MGKTETWTVQQYREYTGQGDGADTQAKLSKHRNKRCVIDGIGFDSQLEGAYYLYLKNEQQEGRISHFHRQVAFDLPGNTKYRVDFLEVMFAGWAGFAEAKLVYTDVKGRETPLFILKKKQVEALYPVTIRCVTKVEIPAWCRNTVKELMQVKV